MTSLITRTSSFKLALILVLAFAALLITAACSGSDSESPASRNEGPVILSDGTLATPTPQPIADEPAAVPDGLQIVWETYSILVREYVVRENIDPNALAEAAVIGMLDSLDDRYTSYIPPSTFKIDQEGFTGKFGGIGAQVEAAPDLNGVIITKPLPNSPAEKSGIKAGDRILAVNGEDALGWSVIEAVNKIRGEKGTDVVLTVEHVGSLDPVDITITRDEIPEISVTANMVTDTNYGRVRIDTFTAETVNELRKEVKQLIDDGAEGIILDLRGNPGGLLSATVDVASEFLTEGLVTYEVDSRGEREDWKVKKGGNFPDIPLVTLVDNFSASGSEVLTGALQDHGRTVAIGTNTFGKGSVNLLRGLSNGGGVYLTIGRWFTPNGRIIEEVGIDPDVVVEAAENVAGSNPQTGDFTDPQVEAAIKQLDFQVSQLTAAP
ncbi:S41 family peptidase [Candidatus Lucifugimonas marina]|jgi:carboxyl-terminal processing protease|uniref:PDZ domain-containing protein n=1 Tax=Candidatus Lucifugimonas marina TaxID=3038979 RepID=A0AAJ5ZFT8_9CHLR|nr:PDZ domain-containing protein [SAR202 cluster bacterium JH702]MDG0868735.1 PDZ domain-containing protein [SAR202 cluster bacterium JH639]WFG35367.1 PDZ domain-containing protein [SAR202 cluster bacterium JH545]WFG39314.1 PDZ domain-containing protein [SAR202 cluster bacterium JH1073]